MLSIGGTIMKRKKGSITIFLALIFLTLLSFIGSIIELSRIHLIQIQNEHNMIVAEHNILATYDAVLFEQYGMLAGEKDTHHTKVAKDTFNARKYKHKNMVDKGIHLMEKETGVSGDMTSFMYPKKQEVTIRYENYLTPDFVFAEQQILSYMEQRKFLIATKEINNIIELWKQPTKIMKVQEEKNEILKEANQIQNIQMYLMKVVDGILIAEDKTIRKGREDVPYVNKYYVKREERRNYEEINDNALRNNLREEQIEIESSIEIIIQELEQIQLLQEEKERIQKEQLTKEWTIKKQLQKEKIERQLEVAITAYSNKVKEIEKLYELVDEMKEAVKEYDTYKERIKETLEKLKKLKNENADTILIYKELEEIEKSMVFQISKEKEGIYEKIKSNIRILEKDKVYIQELKVKENIEGKTAIDISSKKQILKKCKENLKEYKSNLCIDYSGYRKLDTETLEIYNAAKKCFEEEEKEKHKDWLAEILQEVDQVEIIKTPIDREKMPSNILSEKENRTKKDNQMKEEKLQREKTNTLQWEEEVLRNEYILYMLKNAKDAIQKNGVTINGYSKNEHYFNFATEYVLYGKQTEIDNLKLTLSNIMVFRMGMNTAHILSNTAKRQKLMTMANGLTWYCGGIATIAVFSLLVAFWALLESILDIYMLLAGEKVPFMKDTHSWYLGTIGNYQKVLEVTKRKIKKGEKKAEVEKQPKKEVQKETIYSLSYKDYLRILLYTKSITKEEKIARTLDMIQLNLGKYYGRKDLQFDTYYYGVCILHSMEVEPFCLGIPVYEYNLYERTYKIKTNGYDAYEE